MTRWLTSETQEQQSVYQQRKWHIEAQQNPALAVTYAIGDIHGSVSLLRQLLQMLPYRAEDTLIFLGDYLDRGEDSLVTISTLRELAQQHPRCIFLRGNHEDAWLQHWDGLRFSRPPDIDGAQDIWDSCDGVIPFVVGDWLEQTRVEYEDDYAFYVHAGVKPGMPVWRTADFVKLWGAPGFIDSDYDWGKPIVFGHTQFPTPLLQWNKIGIDTGAYKTGILTAIRLPDRMIFQTQLA